ncbi:hypothetical protein HOY80DRAFT_999419 [Tuber brumale]|nr:hypothetical protein HOY80DRAFT_999419 [Tuber brumale]
MVPVSQYPYCNKKYWSSTCYRNHTEKQHPDFVRPLQAVQEIIGDRVQPPNPVPEANETYELSNSSEIQIADYEPESDHSIGDSDVESLKLFEREDRLADFVESRAPTKHHTAGRVLRDAVQRQKAEDELWAPVQNKTHFELAQWFIEAKVPRSILIGILRMDWGPRTVQLNPGLRMRSWKERLVSFTELDIEDTDGLELATSQRRFLYRNHLDCAKYLLSQKCFAHDIVDALVKDWDSETPPARVYSEMHMGDWWRETQEDVTFLTNLSGDKKSWPIYLTIGNIFLQTRNKSLKHASVLLALSPVPSKMLGVASQDSRQRPVKNKILSELIEAIFTPTGAVAEVGIEIQCADGQVPQCFPRLAAWIANYLENITLHRIPQNRYALFETTRDRLGSYTGRSAAIRDYKKYQRLFAEYFNGSSDAADDLINCGFKFHPSVFWVLPDLHQAHLPKPDILHVVYLGIFETHVMKWIIGLLKKYKRLQAFDAVWKNLPAFPGYSPPNKAYSRVSQWTGKEPRLAGLMVTQRWRIADELRLELEGVMADIYDEDVDFNFVKIHLLSHLADHMRPFGNIQMYSTESGETSYKIMIKEGYRLSNEKDASYQILGTYARLDNFKIHEMNVLANDIHPQCDEPKSEQGQQRIGSSVK